jgi:hypothetical protein
MGLQPDQVPQKNTYVPLEPTYKSPAMVRGGHPDTDYLGMGGGSEKNAKVNIPFHKAYLTFESFCFRNFFTGVFNDSQPLYEVAIIISLIL